MNDWVVEGKSFIEELLDGKYFMLNQNGVNAVVKIIKDYKSRNEKAIEYIKEHWVTDNPIKFKNDLLDILQGSDKE